jgi:hypothetical protein
LSPARNNRFVGTEPRPAYKIGDKTYLLELARESENRSELSPRFGAGKSIDQISQTVNLHKCKCISGHIPLHRHARRAPQNKETGDNQTNNQNRRTDNDVSSR